MYREGALHSTRDGRCGAQPSGAAGLLRRRFVHHRVEQQAHHTAPHGSREHAGHADHQIAVFACRERGETQRLPDDAPHQLEPRALRQRDACNRLLARKPPLDDRSWPGYDRHRRDLRPLGECRRGDGSIGGTPKRAASASIRIRRPISKPADSEPDSAGRSANMATKHDPLSGVENAPCQSRGHSAAGDVAFVVTSRRGVERLMVRSLWPLDPVLWCAASMQSVVFQPRSASRRQMSASSRHPVALIESTDLLKRPPTNQHACTRDPVHLAARPERPRHARWNPINPTEQLRQKR